MLLTISAARLAEHPEQELEKALTFAGLPADRKLILDVAARNAGRLETLAAAKARGDTDSRLGEILEEEATASSNWPCRTLHVDDAALPFSGELLAANCSAPAVHCTVKHDRSESRVA